MFYFGLKPALMRIQDLRRFFGWHPWASLSFWELHGAGLSVEGSAWPPELGVWWDSVCTWSVSHPPKGFVDPAVTCWRCPVHAQIHRSNYSHAGGCETGRGPAVLELPMESALVRGAIHRISLYITGQAGSERGWRAWLEAVVGFWSGDTYFL